MAADAGPNGHSELEKAHKALRVSEQQLTVVTEALRKADQRAVAGRLALEVMHEVKNPLEAPGHLTYLALQEVDNRRKCGGTCSWRRSKCKP